jgi:hypothetical protein
LIDGSTISFFVFSKSAPPQVFALVAEVRLHSGRLAPLRAAVASSTASYESAATSLAQAEATLESKRVECEAKAALLQSNEAELRIIEASLREKMNEMLRVSGAYVLSQPCIPALMTDDICLAK